MDRRQVLVTSHLHEAQQVARGELTKAEETAFAADLVVKAPCVVGDHQWKVVLPAGVVERVDHADESIYVDLTKEQIKAAPDYDKDDWGDDSRGRHPDYYTPYSSR